MGTVIPPIKKWATNDGAANDSLYFNISGQPDLEIDTNGIVEIKGQTGRTNLVMGRVTSSDGYHGRWMYGGYHLDIYYSLSYH